LSLPLALFLLSSVVVFNLYARESGFPNQDPAVHAKIENPAITYTVDNKLNSSFTGGFYLPNTILSDQFHKIITLNKEIFAADKVEIISGKIGFQDSFNGRYFLLDTSEVALIIYKNGIQKMIADPEVARRCLNDISDLNDYTSREPAITLELSAEEQKYFERRATMKARTFGDYLRILSDASSDELLQNDAIKEAVKLFYDEDRMVEVSSVNRETVDLYKVEDYLKHIRALNYARVELLWSKIAYINQIKRGEDGEYHGVITVEQIFRGYDSDNQLIYQDVTQKNIDIIVKPLNQVLDGKEVSKWDVFLSDIGVRSTTAE
ncbi:MAG: hypothetical protein AAF992_10635, partial [Bacteroidota bacterium]